MSSHLRAAATLLLACGQTSCRLIAAPLQPGAVPFPLPAVYARWWGMTEACSGHSRDMRSIEWYRVPGPGFARRGQSVAGYYSTFTHRLVIAAGYEKAGDVVRHEMLHAILQTSGHPRSEFLGACASVVVCQANCKKDAGPWRPPRSGFVVLPPDSFEISSHAELLPREADGDRWLTLWVIVRNPRNRAAGVSIPPPADPIAPPTFEFNVRGSPGRGISGGEVATDSSTLVFGPQETKRFLFEWRVGSTLNRVEIVPGRYLVQGGYVHRYAPFDTVMVQP